MCEPVCRSGIISNARITTTQFFLKKDENLEIGASVSTITHAATNQLNPEIEMIYTI